MLLIEAGKIFASSFCSISDNFESAERIWLLNGFDI